MIFSGTWDKEEILEYKKQASVVMEVCQLLLSSLFKDVHQIETGNTAAALVPVS